MKHFLLTGPPGIGKTTCVRRTAEQWLATGGAVAGFFTEEVRDRGRRIGFDIVGFDGSRFTLARQQQLAEFDSSARVGQYLVDVASLDEASARLLERLPTTPSLTSKQLIVIDEIGKMELFGQRFRSACESALAAARCSEPPFSLLATLPSAWRHPLVDSLRRDTRHFQLVEVAQANRDALPDWLIANACDR